MFVPFVDQLVLVGVTRLSLHDVVLCLFVGEGDSRHHIGSQVDAQDGDDPKRQGDVSQDEHQEGRDLRDVGGQGVGDGFLQVVKDQTTCNIDNVT